ncbi:MAG: cache domain-containing protein [Telluria sp.]
MKKLMGVFLALAALAFGMGSATAAERGTADEAIAMVHKAAAMLKKDGREKLFAEVNNPSGQFVKGDLYVFIHDMKGICLAHGGNPKLIGQNLLDLKDATGYNMVKGFIETAQSKGKGWVDYKWPNKVTKQVENKSTYVEKHDDLIISVGIYKA